MVTCHPGRSLGAMRRWLRAVEPEIAAAATDALIVGLTPEQIEEHAVAFAAQRVRAQQATDRAIRRLFAKRRGLASLGMGVACYPWPVGGAS